MVFLCEFGVGLHVVQTHAKHFGAGLVQLEHIIAKGTDLGGAAGCVVFRIKV